MSHKVLITGALHPDTIAQFESAQDIDLDYRPDCPRSDLLKIIADKNVLITRSETTIDQELLEQAKQLKMVARAAVGVGNIDIPSATERGILVINCPGKNTNSAAELTIGLILALYRHIAEAYHVVSKGGWDRHRFAGKELQNKTIGIVGLGNVGHRVAKFANGFDMNVLAFDPYIAPENFKKHGAVRCETLEKLLEQVDILSVHVPLNRETTGMITAKELNQLKSGSVVINAARGGVIHEDDIVSALDSGHISGYGVDTFVNEPNPKSKLISHPKVICTPHIGATTEEAQIRIGQTTFEQVRKFCDGTVVDYPVNLPQVGTIDDHALRSYSVLAEKLGSLMAQTIQFNPSSIEMSFRGEIAEKDHSLIRLGLLKGYVGQIVDGYVSFVNVDQHIKDFGISISETTDPEFTGYRSALKIIIRGRDNEKMTLGGIVFDSKYLRISLVNEFYFEVEPTGYILLIENFDKPGVVGNVGKFLGDRSININSFNLSRNSKGGKAMALISIDEDIPKSEMLELLKIENISSAKVVSL